MSLPLQDGKFHDNAERAKADFLETFGNAQAAHHLHVYTDGSCIGNPGPGGPGPGGWAAIFCFQDGNREIFGAEPYTTHNRMELMAPIMALESLKQPCRVKSTLTMTDLLLTYSVFIVT